MKAILSGSSARARMYYQDMPGLHGENCYFSELSQGLKFLLQTEISNFTACEESLVFRHLDKQTSHF